MPCPCSSVWQHSSLSTDVLYAAGPVPEILLRFAWNGSFPTIVCAKWPAASNLRKAVCAKFCRIFDDKMQVAVHSLYELLSNKPACRPPAAHRIGLLEINPRALSTPENLCFHEFLKWWFFGLTSDVPSEASLYWRSIRLGHMASRNCVRVPYDTYVSMISCTYINCRRIRFI